ncbi:50S ribosome-binding GTPase [Photobacterium sp. DA100]|uniref:YcjF family protein n=1 Tax=Photobacterium sp. DA100 TaxID=3027472 RepID=UPI002478FC2C|nr:GTPase [Photobacterium sp. DA100]WEM41023.1 50S ribosome-binding GTPase [Photobacterium sp. DA100]
MQQFFKNIYQYINPDKDPGLQAANQLWESSLPTLWLLGKTGAGKSTLVATVTGNELVEVGNGFQPCTQTAVEYSFPADNPVLRFLDTRGLSEADYDPAEDISACQAQSHALLVVMKAEEPEQSDVLSALKKIRKDGRIDSVLVVHTACLSIVDPEQRLQAIRYNQDQVEKVWGTTLMSVNVDFQAYAAGMVAAHGREPFGLSALNQQLADMLPIIHLMQQAQRHLDAEHSNFLKLQQEVMWYAGSAAATDALPGVGMVSVPALQGKMLHSLARQYGVEWNRKRFSEFAGLLGSSFALKYATKLGLRQLAKFIPVYGQTVGSAVAVAISFALTYAIGRAGCKYLYHISRGETVDETDIRQVFEQALKQAKSSQAGRATADNMDNRQDHEKNNQ